MKFSIIIPTLNRGYIIEKALNSIYNQTGQHDLEILVVDDGSTDNTRELLTHHPQVIYIPQAHAGLSAARNTGLRYARGEWIVYLDTDNELYPEYFETVDRALQNNPHTLYAMVRAYKTKELYKDGKLVQALDDKENNLKNVTREQLYLKLVHFDVNGFLHKKSILGSGIAWDEHLARQEDTEFFMQLAEQYPQGFLYIPTPLLHYHMRFGTDSILSQSSYADWAATLEYVYEKHKTNPLMAKQTWYPRGVEKYRQLQKDFEQGKAPQPYLRYFQ